MFFFKNAIRSGINSHFNACLFFAAATVTVSTMSVGASSQDIVFTPVNPSFGGNPFNSAHLLSIANAQNSQIDPATLNADGRAPTQSELFVRQLQSRLLSSLAREVSDAIFGENPQDSGRVVFGDQTVEFTRGIDSVQLTIFDATTGTETAIEIPIFATAGAAGTGVTTAGLSSLLSPLLPGSLGGTATSPAPAAPKPEPAATAPLSLVDVGQIGGSK